MGSQHKAHTVTRICHLSIIIIIIIIYVLKSILYTFRRKLLQASIRANKTGHFIWIGSDSWGAKAHPVREQEYAAVNTITVLPQRTNLEGKPANKTSEQNSATP